MAQLIYIVLAVLGLGITLAKHGEPKTGEHNILVTLINAILVFALLYWGGFFDDTHYGF